MSFGAGLDGGRDEADSVYLAGLGDIDSGAEFTFGLEYEFGVMQAFASVSQLTSGSEGMTAEFGIGTQIPAAVLFGNGGADHSENRRGPMLSASLSATWADDSYTQSYFGVTTAQAGTSAYSAYDASAGIKSVDLNFGVMVPLSENWMAQGMVSYSRLMGDAADSPLVRDEKQYGVGLLVGYSF